MDYFIVVAVSVVVGALGMWGAVTVLRGNTLAAARKDAQQIEQRARDLALSTGREAELKVKQDQLAAREAFDRDQEALRRKMGESEQRLVRREETLDRKTDTLAVKEKSLEQLDGKLASRSKVIEVKEQDVTRTLEEQRQKLLQVSGMSVDQAKEILLRRIEDDMQSEAGMIVRKYTEQAQEEGKEKARNIILQAIQRYAAEQTSDHTTSALNFGDDAIKGRIIGREGRNIRSFERITGVEVIVDDTPGVVVISCFDPVRREIARRSLERLVQDGRIHPARIEEIVSGVTAEMDEDLTKHGRTTIEQLQLLSVKREIYPTLGRLHFRTSYGQNVLKHSMEVAYLCQVMASELGLDPTLARRAGLLHDIGKAIDHEHEGNHTTLGYELLRKLNEPEAVLNAALAHHGDQPATTPYTLLVMAADAISASRPGARRESLEKYVKRLKDLEALAVKFDGVTQAYAIQAGREVRVIVDAKRIDDPGSAKLARDIAKQIESTQNYPGEIKVTVLRETRNVEFAK